VTPQDNVEPSGTCGHRLPAQSSAAQVENNRESTHRQYALVNKATDLGWTADNVLVIDEDLGLSGSGAVARSGFRPLDRRGRARTRGSRSGS